MIDYVRPDRFHYPSRRSEVYARNVVATSQPLAAEAGLAMLRRGGNAVDAALAAAICLTVVEPASNGIGGDAFAIVWDGARLHGFNGSGRAPRAFGPERFRGLAEMPQQGWDSVTVPGAVDAWARLSERFGRLPFEELFQPAIHYARSGYHLTPIIQRQWRESIAEFGGFAEFRDAFMPNGRAPEVGELVTSPDHAATLEELAATRGESFYRGELAGRIAAHARAGGGALDEADLAAHRGDWVAPLGLRYRRLTVHELPPNGQGLAALIALGILERLEPGRHAVDSTRSTHLQVEAMKLAFVDLFAEVADADSMRVAPSTLLDPRRLDALAARVSPDAASRQRVEVPADHGTVYLCAADAAGNMASMIQSNYHGFGSGIVVPGTGISLHNRGAGFRLEPGHPNRVAGGKRPFHTIIPGFITGDAGAVGPFGVMGAHMQAQGHVQFVVRAADYGQHPQEILDAPRWHVSRTFELNLEAGFPPATVEGLARLGHRIEHAPDWKTFGGGQCILRTGDALVGASDPRKDGCAVGF